MDMTTEAPRIAIRRCRTPACRGCGDPAAVHVLSLPADGRSVRVGSGPFPAGREAAESALAEFERRWPGAELHYEMCAQATGPVRADRAGWLARESGSRNFAAPG